MSGVQRGLTHRAQTHPASPDPSLRGRTYTIPFDDVWERSLELASGDLHGWSVVRADDQAGVIEALVTTLVLRRTDEVRIEIGLDENAQTRVDLWSASRGDRLDWGRNRRRVGNFLDKLDRRLQAGPDQILDPTARGSWNPESH